MEDAAQREREDTFRADVARLVQAMQHHLPSATGLTGDVLTGDVLTGDAPAGDVSPEVTALLEPVQHLGSLLEDGAPVEHLQEAALAVVDSYDWPSPEASSGGEGPAIDGAILAAVERLRDAMDAMDELDDEA